MGFEVRKAILDELLEELKKTSLNEEQRLCCVPRWLSPILSGEQKAIKQKGLKAYRRVCRDRDYAAGCLIERRRTLDQMLTACKTPEDRDDVLLNLPPIYVRAMTDEEKGYRLLLQRKEQYKRFKMKKKDDSDAIKPL
jgi:hypothetical protein